MNSLFQRFLGGYGGGERAAILRRSPGEITFAVDDVTPATEPLCQEDAAVHLARRLDREVLASSLSLGETVVEEEAWRNPLVAAIHRAFAEHRPLCLSPDTIWLTIAQGFSHHVALHAEELRDRLVFHHGKERLTVTVDLEELTEPEQWGTVVDAWAELIDARSTVDARRLLVCDFSTTTPVIRTASQIVMMEAFKHYFDYELLCICGIPEVTLLGTPHDWRSIRERVSKLSRFDLEWWTQRLLLICDALILTAEGRPPLAFWQAIYKPKAAYGSEVITGWLSDLFPYLKDGVTESPTVRNPILAMPRSEITVESGLSDRVIPIGLSFAPFRMTRPSGVTCSREVVGGFLGVMEKSSRGGEIPGTLEPMIGWAIRPADTFSALLDTLLERAQKPLSAPVADVAALAIQYAAYFHASGFPLELMRLLECSQEIRMNFAEDKQISFRISGQPVSLRSPNWIPAKSRLDQGTPDESLIPFGEASDGRILACMHSFSLDRILEHPSSLPRRDRLGRTKWWVFVGRTYPWWNAGDEQDEGIMPLSESCIVASDLPTFFERLLASPDRLFFDAPDFVPEYKP